MIYLESPSTDPTFNLALEQYVFDHLDRKQEYFMLWQNENSIIIGKNQNTIEEINQTFVTEHGIHVVLRLSGGGAVYHDMGSLNFTFIVDNTDQAGMDLKKFSLFVANALKKLGIPAQAGGRNDILINGLKFSGNAQYLKNGRIMHQGTLMFDSDRQVLSQALRVSEQKIASKGIKSVKSRVTNIKEHLPEPMTLAEFKSHLLNCLFSHTELSYYTLTEEDLLQIQTLQQNVYRTWEWNYGYSPKYEIKKQKRFEGCGEIQICMNVEKGIITEFAAYGDYFGTRDTRELNALIAGTRMNETDLEHALWGLEIGLYFNSLTKQELIDFITGDL